MCRFFSPMLVLLLVLAAVPVATVAQEINPNYSMSVVGPDTFTGQPGTVLADRFRVRIVDRQGKPASGFIVWFYPNCTFTVPELPTPPCAKGSFIGVTPEQLLTLTTDADGVAVAPPYQVEGSVDIAAGAYDWGDGTPNDAIGWPPLVQFFHVNHAANDPTIHPPPVENPGGQPHGDVRPVGAPALSMWSLLALILFTAVIGAAGRKWIR